MLYIFWKAGFLIPTMCCRAGTQRRLIPVLGSMLPVTPTIMWFAWRIPSSFSFLSVSLFQKSKFFFLTCDSNHVVFFSFLLSLLLVVIGFRLSNKLHYRWISETWATLTFLGFWAQNLASYNIFSTCMFLFDLLFDFKNMSYLIFQIVQLNKLIFGFYFVLVYIIFAQV